MIGLERKISPAAQRRATLLRTTLPGRHRQRQNGLIAYRYVAGKSGFGNAIPSAFRSRGEIALALNFDVQPLDFLIERREWNPEALGRVGLAPVIFVQLLDDHALFEIVHDVEQRGFGGTREAGAPPLDGHAARREKRVWQGI